MKGFKIDKNGDVVIEKNRIQMVEGNELLSQTVHCVLNTNKGEWVFNPNEGINFYNILGKHTATSETSEDQAMKRHYTQRIADIQSDMNDIAEKLEKRLDGEM